MMVLHLKEVIGKSLNIFLFATSKLQFHRLTIVHKNMTKKTEYKTVVSEMKSSPSWLIQKKKFNESNKKILLAEHGW